MRPIAVTALFLALPAPALACGAFFCARGLPMDQSAERIVFGIDEQAGTVETHVQISYTGEASRFAWIVPVPGVPQVDLSTDVLFQTLNNVTQPQWWVSTRWIECDQGDTGWDAADGGTNGGGSSGGTGGVGGGGGIDILASGQTGPYDWKVVSADSEASLRTWLGDPDGDPGTADAYDVPPGTSERLATYLADGSNFIAVKLLPSATTGDIAPLMLKWPGDHATIPLVLTGLAATPDLRLQVYVLGDHRAVPLNYLHVKVNEAAVDWFSNGSNYDAVITRAANEAGGQAFATDAFVELTDGLLFAPTPEQMAGLAVYRNPVRFFDQLVGLGIPGNDITLDLFRKWLPMPQALADEGVRDTDFYNCLACYEASLSGVDFDPAGFAADLEARVAAPMRKAGATLDAARFVTRLTSSVSPEEMTLDPRFGFNPDMDATLLSPFHQATQVVDCTGGVAVEDAPRRMELPDGTTFPLPPGTDRTNYADWLAGVGLPAALQIERTSESGAPVLISDKSAEVAALLNATEPTDTDTDADSDTDSVDCCKPGVEAECGCDQSSSAGGLAAGLGLLLLGLRRRRG